MIRDDEAIDYRTAYRLPSDSPLLETVGALLKGLTDDPAAASAAIAAADEDAFTSNSFAYTVLDAASVVNDVRTMVTRLDRLNQLVELNDIRVAGACMVCLSSSVFTEFSLANMLLSLFRSVHIFFLSFPYGYHAGTRKTLLMHACVPKYQAVSLALMQLPGGTDRARLAAVCAAGLQAVHYAGRVVFFIVVYVTSFVCVCAVSVRFSCFLNFSVFFHVVV